MNDFRMKNMKIDTERWLILLKNDRNVEPAELPPNDYRENGGPAPRSNDVSHRESWCFRELPFLNSIFWWALCWCQDEPFSLEAPVRRLLHPASIQGPSFYSCYSVS